MDDTRPGGAEDDSPVQIPVAISARHVHLTQASVDKLFGAGYQLRVRAPLTQLGQFAAEETVTLIGQAGSLPLVRVVGPTRAQDQVEVSRSDEIVLGINAPVRDSGNLAATPGIDIEGPVGSISIASGVICALRHIHMSPADAVVLGVRDGALVEVAVQSGDRRLVFCDVLVRVSSQFLLEMHLDTDEANAAGLHPGSEGLLMPTRGRASVLTSRQP